MNFKDDFVVDDPLTFGYFLEGEFDVNIFRFGSHACFFVSPSLVYLNYLEMISPSSVCLNSSGIVIILLSCELARLEFAVLVIFDFRLCSKLPCLFLFLLYFSFVFVSRGRQDVSFLVLFCLIRFVGT